ncbi:MAG TPA: hypothetical protein VFF84_02635 [Sphingobium sp.]|nr:hypothetical protein [Sphingobium sp.]
MNSALKRRAGIVLAFCIIVSGCGEKLVVPSNEAETVAAQSDLSAVPEDAADADSLIDRKPRKILSPDEKRRVANLLKIYREARATAASGDEAALKESAQNRQLAEEGLDKIDPNIMAAERRREAALDEREFDKKVDALLREQNEKPASQP